MITSFRDGDTESVFHGRFVKGLPNEIQTRARAVSSQSCAFVAVKIEMFFLKNPRQVVVSYLQGFFRKKSRFSPATLRAAANLANERRTNAWEYAKAIPRAFLLVPWPNWLRCKYAGLTRNCSKHKLDLLHVAKKLDDLKIPPSNQLEKLSGNRNGQYSIRINRQWRICFTFKDGNAYRVEIVDYH